MFDVKTEVAALLASKVPVEQQKMYDMLEIPPNPEMGDLALPCFKLSRILKKPPVQIAQDLASAMPENENIERVENVKNLTDYIERIDEMIERKRDFLLRNPQLQ